MPRTRPVPFLVALVLTLACALSAQAQGPPQFLFAFGGDGAGPGQLQLPRSLAIHGNEIFVLEYGNDRVSVFDLQGNYLRHWGSSGTAENQFYTPKQITVTPSGDVYVTDHMLHRVQKFTTDGVFQLSWGSQGSANSQLNQPDGITFDADGDIWVVDRLNNALKEFDANGNFLSSVTSPDLVGATDVAPTAEGTFHATIWNTLYAGMRHVDASATLLGQTSTWFYSPRGLSEGPDGYLYVVASGPANRAYVIDPATLGLITDWGGYGDADDQFDLPYDVAVSPAGLVYIADSGHDLVKVFGYPTAIEAMTWGKIKAKHR